MSHLRLRIRFNKGKRGVPLDRLEHVFEQVRKFLFSAGEDIELTEPKNWRAGDFTNASLGFEAEYQMEVGPQKLGRFNDAIIAMARSEFPPSLSEYTINQFFEITAYLDPEEVADISVYGEDEQAIEVPLSRKIALTAQSLNLLPFRESVGSVQGTIHSLYKEASQPYFVLRELSSRNLINCLYGPDDYAAIIHSLENRDQVVHVRGLILSDTRKRQIRHVRVQNLIPAEPFGFEDVEKFLRTNRTQ